MSRIVCQISFRDNPKLYGGSFEIGKDNSLIKVRIGSVDDVQINLKSTITTHPIVTGDMISDHMYKDPLSITITGVLSLHGDSFECSLGQRTISQMQRLFERVKENGIFCEVMKFDTSIGETIPRFLKRDNMVLTDIQWTEDIDDVKFSFTFNEVLTAKISVDVVETSDSNLPQISDLVESNFTETLLDFSQLTEYVTQAFYDVGLITDEFLEGAANSAKIALVAGTAASIIAISSGIGTAVGTALFPGLGTAAGYVGGLAIGAAVASVTAVVTSIKRAIDTAKYRVKVFENWEEDGDRFIECVGEINKLVSELNNQISVYRFANDGAQIAFGDINGEYYKFQFDSIEMPETKINTGFSTYTYPAHPSYSLRVFDLDNNQLASLSTVDTAPTEFASCLSSNALFRTKYGRWVFLLQVGKKTTQHSGSGGSFGSGPVRDSLTRTVQIEPINLTNCYLVSSSIKPENYQETLYNIILEAVKYDG